MGKAAPIQTMRRIQSSESTTARGYSSADFCKKLRLREGRMAMSLSLEKQMLGAVSLDSYSLAMVRVGIGYDVHALVEGRKLVLGGVEIKHPKGLDGHSDADVLMHAICDAVLGAIGAGDIGHFFPNTD